MVEDLLELPDSVPRVILFDVINDVVVRNDFLVIVVDEAFESGHFSCKLRVIHHIIFVFVNALYNFGTTIRIIHLPLLLIFGVLRNCSSII